MLKGEVDGRSSAGSSTPIVDSFDSVQHLLLSAVLVKVKFQPLFISVLHSSDPGICIRNLKLLANIGYKLQNGAEVTCANAARSINDKPNVRRI